MFGRFGHDQDGLDLDGWVRDDLCELGSLLLGIWTHRISPHWMVHMVSPSDGWSNVLGARVLRSNRWYPGPSSPGSRVRTSAQIWRSCSSMMRTMPCRHDRYTARGETGAGCPVAGHSSSVAAGVLIYQHHRPPSPGSGDLLGCMLRARSYPSLPSPPPCLLRVPCAQVPSRPHACRARRGHYPPVRPLPLQPRSLLAAGTAPDPTGRVYPKFRFKVDVRQPWPPT